MSDKKLIVQREKFDYKGKEYLSYFIKGVVKGREVKATLKPQDINGYTILDIIFEGANEVELIAKPYSITDDNGNVISGNTYIVRSVDENGEVYECPVKHSRASDKVLLNMLMK
ncbi:MAG: hypothetical protein IKA31_05550 [Clostridia bacterium]|nr:hypothetical protein [Clostridia bacterium]